MRSTSVLATAILAASIIVRLLWDTLTVNGRNFVDLHVYRDGSAGLADGSLYLFTYSGSTDFALPFTYPPFAAVVLYPLSLLPWGLVALLWNWRPSRPCTAASSSPCGCAVADPYIHTRGGVFGDRDLVRAGSGDPGLRPDQRVPDVRHPARGVAGPQPTRPARRWCTHRPDRRDQADAGHHRALVSGGAQTTRWVAAALAFGATILGCLIFFPRSPGPTTVR